LRNIRKWSFIQEDSYALGIINELRDPLES
jgi:hypothetical protein